ncbi:substrate-binding domain-containing protein [Rhizosaccharibacter radicis]|uniref:Substrate-binding domain-containing protein n=1 Tax=Rhizosaccharibacter radicis TaxID=2782605 RepID=A0ABT1VSI6_9PROT|nr:substrate-binding domain-containing protein [Acetobacteraceae bacterium KSS12]
MKQTRTTTRGTTLLAATLAAGLATAAAASAQAAPADTKPVTIILVDHGQAADPFHNVIKRGAQDAAKQLGVHLEIRQPDNFDMTQMANLITAAANQKPDGLVTTVPDAEALSGPIKRAIAQGIPVIATNDAPANGHKVGALLNVGQDETAAGRAAGKAMAAAGAKKAICVNQEVGNVALDERCSGFAEGFGGNSKVLPVETDPSVTKSKIEAALRSDPSIDAIIGLNASLVGEPAVQAVQELGRTGKVKVASFDLSAGMLRNVADGKAVFVVDQQPYLQGYLPVLFLTQRARYGLLPSGDVASGPNLITKDQAAKVIDLSSAAIR